MDALHKDLSRMFPRDLRSYDIGDSKCILRWLHNKHRNLGKRGCPRPRCHHSSNMLQPRTVKGTAARRAREALGRDFARGKAWNQRKAGRGGKVRKMLRKPNRRESCNGDEVDTGEKVSTATTEPEKQQIRCSGVYRSI